MKNYEKIEEKIEELKLKELEIAEERIKLEEELEK